MACAGPVSPPFRRQHRPGPVRPAHIARQSVTRAVDLSHEARRRPAWPTLRIPAFAPEGFRHCDQMIHIGRGHCVLSALFPVPLRRKTKGFQDQGHIFFPDRCHGRSNKRQGSSENPYRSSTTRFMGGWGTIKSRLVLILVMSDSFPLWLTAVMPSSTSPDIQGNDGISSGRATSVTMPRSA
jgi:hypothetical protein